MNTRWFPLKTPRGRRRLMAGERSVRFVRRQTYRLQRLIEELSDPHRRSFHLYYYGRRRVRPEKRHPICVTRLRLYGPTFENTDSPILFISDLHFRGHPIEDYLLDFLIWRPWRVLLLGGDYQPEPGIDPEGQWTLRFLRSMRAFVPERRVVAVAGNHDSPALMARMRALGVEVLEDDVTSIPIGSNGTRFGILGSRDPHRSNPCPERLSRLIKGHDTIEHWLVLAHSPDILLWLPGDPRIRLILTGHTHGGQLALGRHQPVWHNTRVRRQYASGIRSVYNGWIYTSRGFGYTFAPVRVMCPPEVVEIVVLKGPVLRLEVEEEYWLTSAQKITRVGTGNGNQRISGSRSNLKNPEGRY